MGLVCFTTREEHKAHALRQVFENGVVVLCA